MALKRKRVTADDLLRLQERNGSKHSGKQPNVRYDSSNSEGEESGPTDEGSEDGDHKGPEDSSEPSEGVEISRLRPTSFQGSPQRAGNASSYIAPPDFTSLGISSPLIAALTAMSIKLPTEVQLACIPPLLAGELSAPLNGSSFITLS